MRKRGRTKERTKRDEERMCAQDEKVRVNRRLKNTWRLMFLSGRGARSASRAKLRRTRTARDKEDQERCQRFRWTLDSWGPVRKRVKEDKTPSS